jgi:hypothetical protein
LSFKFESVVENTENIKIPLSSVYNISLNRLIGSKTASGVFLRLTTNEYLLEIGGRNGEPISRQRIDLTLTHLYWHEPIKQALLPGRLYHI